MAHIEGEDMPPKIPFFTGLKANQTSHTATCRSSDKRKGETSCSDSEVPEATQSRAPQVVNAEKRVCNAATLSNGHYPP